MSYKQPQNRREKTNRYLARLLRLELDKVFPTHVLYECMNLRDNYFAPNVVRHTLSLKGLKINQPSRA